MSDPFTGCTVVNLLWNKSLTSPTKRAEQVVIATVIEPDGTVRNVEEVVQFSEVGSHPLKVLPGSEVSWKLRTYDRDRHFADSEVNHFVASTALGPAPATDLCVELVNPMDGLSRPSGTVTSSPTPAAPVAPAAPVTPPVVPPTPSPEPDNPQGQPLDNKEEPEQEQEEEVATPQAAASTPAPTPAAPATPRPQSPPPRRR